MPTDMPKLDIYKSTLKVKEIQSHNIRSFEHVMWSMSTKNKSLTITGIYHLPPKAGITNAMFVNDITEHLSELLTNKQNNIILGDFNIHVDDPFDSEAGIFNNTITAFRLQQQVTHPTHNKGNTLDLMFIEASKLCSLEKCKWDQCCQTMLLPLVNLTLRNQK